MSSFTDRRLDLDTMLGQIEQVLRRGRPTDPPAFTLILGAGASFGVVPTARQMLGIRDAGGCHSACIPAFLHSRESDTALAPADLDKCVQDFWVGLTSRNAGRCKFRLDTRGIPTLDAVPEAYRFLFAQDCVGGLNSPGEAREYLRHVTMGDNERTRLNGTHFFLGSLLSLQNHRDAYIGRRPFARTIFTTNFDPLLQVALQLFHNLYYMTDRPDLLASDALHTDDHPALHLFYAHGSVHRPGPKNTDDEIRLIKSSNAKAIAPYFATHGVIVLGYSGWDDCLLRALEKSTSFKNNLYWLVRGDGSMSDQVCAFLRRHPNAFLVPITDGGDFMATLHQRLCPSMAMTELLANPIIPLRERLERVDLSGIRSVQTCQRSEAIDEPATAEGIRVQVVGLLQRVQGQFTETSGGGDPAWELQKLLHQANIAYSNGDWETARELYQTIVGNRTAAPSQQAESLFRRGHCAGRLGDVKAEMTDYSSVIQMAGAPPEVIGRALLNRGVCHRHFGDSAAAATDYSRCIELVGSNPTTVAKALINRGVLHENGSRIKEAIADFSWAASMVTTAPDHVAQSLLNRAACHRKNGDTNAQIDDYTRVVESPGVAPALIAEATFNRGVVHGEHGRVHEAIRDYSLAIDLPGATSSVVAMALVNRGVRQAKLGNTQAAEADFTAVISMQGAPKEWVSHALLNRSQCYGAGTIEDRREIDDLKRLVELPMAPELLVKRAKARLAELDAGDKPGP